MEIYISEEDILRNIQNKFREVYPYLKLECYLSPCEKGKAPRQNEKISPDTPIEEIRLMHTFGWMDISEHRTVAEVEKEFYRYMGLAIRIFRKGRNGWLPTSNTGAMTLAAQNALGKESMMKDTARTTI